MKNKARVNLVPTHHNPEEQGKIEVCNRCVQIEIKGKAMWNFFSLRGVLLNSLQEIVKEGHWTQEKMDRFQAAIQHCRTHGALQFVADGFQVVLKPVEAILVVDPTFDSEEEQE